MMFVLVQRNNKPDQKNKRSHWEESSALRAPVWLTVPQTAFKAVSALHIFSSPWTADKTSKGETEQESARPIVLATVSSSSKVTDRTIRSINQWVSSPKSLRRLKALDLILSCQSLGNSKHAYVHETTQRCPRKPGSFPKIWRSMCSVMTDQGSQANN